MTREPDLLTGKMSWVSDRLKRAQGPARGRGDGVDPAVLREAQGHLYAAQSSQAQAQRVRPGFPFQLARQDVYRHLLRAERVLDRMEQPGGSSCGAAGASAEPAPSEAEGRRAGYPAGRGGRGILLASGDLTLLVDPHRGGQIVELSDKVAARNLLDVQAGPRVPVRRAALVDHLLPEGTGLEAFLRGEIREARGFSDGRYEGRVQRSGSSVQAVLARRGTLPPAAAAGRSRGGAAGASVACTKSVALSRAGRAVRVRQRLRAGGARRGPGAGAARIRRFLFATEINLGLKDAHVNRVGEAEGIRRFAVVDPGAALQVSWVFSRPARLWHFPLESGSGLNRVYQGVRLCWVWPVGLAPGGSWEVRWELTVGAPHGAVEIQEN